jgi:hypothetical protein
MARGRAGAEAKLHAGLNEFQGPGGGLSLLKFRIHRNRWVGRAGRPSGAYLARFRGETNPGPTRNAIRHRSAEARLKAGTAKLARISDAVRFRSAIIGAGPVALSDSDAGIAPAGIAAFIAVQFAGALVALVIARWLWHTPRA